MAVSHEEGQWPWKLHQMKLKVATPPLDPKPRAPKAETWRKLLPPSTSKLQALPETITNDCLSGPTNDDQLKVTETSRKPSITLFDNFHK